MVSKHKTKSSISKHILETITAMKWMYSSIIPLDNAPLKMQSKIIFHAGRIQYQKIRTPTPPPRDTVSYFKLHAHLCDVPTFLNNKIHDLSIASGKLCPSLHLLRTTQCRTRRSSVVSREGVCAADWRCQQLCIERIISDHEGRSVVTPWKRTVPSRLGWSAAILENRDHFLDSSNYSLCTEKYATSNLPCLF